MSGVVTDAGRRDFLKLSALAGGGLVIGLTLPGCGRKRPAGSAAGGMPNAFLRIGGDNTITILVDKSEMGQGVYTALPMLVAEELEVPLAAVSVEAAPPGEAYVNTLIGVQVTGGSTSVREGWDKLRQAGATARVMLVQAAAAAWEVDASECRVEGGQVINADGDALTYGQVAEAASKLPVPADVPLKAPGAFKLIGTPARRTDSAGKVDGTATYGIDVRLPGMLYASIAMPPALGGSAAAVDSAAAEAMPGVRKVVQTSRGVVVVADHWWQARQARDALKVSWDDGPNARLDTAGVFATLARVARPGAGLAVRSDGDAAAAIAGAARRWRAVYRLPLLAHATLEPQNCTADVRADGCDLYAPTQIQGFAQAAAAAAAGLEPGQVKVHTTLLGGGFGRRLEVDFIPAAVEASKAAGRPVQLIYTREDDTTHDAYRPPAHDIAEGALDGDGRLVAWRLHLCGPSITARMFPSPPDAPPQADPFAVEAAQNYPYDVPNVSVDYLRQEIGFDVGYWRSVSHALNCFVAESFMDELAHAAKQDPYQFRRGLLGKQPRYRRVLEEAAAMAGWGQAPAGRHQGIALMEGYGTYLAQVAEVSVRGGALAVHRVVCAVDCGRMVNPAIVESQIESGIVFGLTAALWGEITLERGRVQQGNFDRYRLLRLNESPVIEVKLLASEEAPGGIGEPSTALVAPAVCNAIFAATGRRLRELPIAKALKV
ncbi:MAG TPA: xanthine dehydrogenase family protein molybdopterin-binding subunit [Steroidobacteraceae bacterium]|nr:xanthine dehydrogenase family protein molybdopterin-binding subunit [Steroidobacteraceae bacterium]